MKLAFLLCLVPFFARAQEDPQPLHLRFSIELAGGYTTSFIHTNEFFYWCDVGPCPELHARYEAVQKGYWEGLVNFKFNSRNQFGIGFSHSSFGSRSYYFLTDVNKWIHDEFAFEYNSFKLRHKLALLRGKKLAMGIGNSISVDRLRSKEVLQYIDIKKKGISHIAEAVFSFAANNHLGLNISFLLRTAISKYSSSSFRNDFHRLGRGMTLGLSYSL